jgi:hypothetical protein
MSPAAEGWRDESAARRDVPDADVDPPGTSAHPSLNKHGAPWLTLLHSAALWILIDLGPPPRCNLAELSIPLVEIGLSGSDDLHHIYRRRKRPSAQLPRLTEQLGRHGANTEVFKILGTGPQSPRCRQNATSPAGFLRLFIMENAIPLFLHLTSP